MNIVTALYVNHVQPVNVYWRHTKRQGVISEDEVLN